MDYLKFRTNTGQIPDNDKFRTKSGCPENELIPEQFPDISHFPDILNMSGICPESVHYLT